MKTSYLVLTVLLISVLACAKEKRTAIKNEEVISLIKSKTDLLIPAGFTVLHDSVVYTAGAFDSDYIYSLCLHLSKDQTPGITEKICGTAYFDKARVQNYADSVWKKVDLENKKGLWCRDEIGYRYLHASSENREPFHLVFDTMSNTLKLTLNHL